MGWLVSFAVGAAAGLATSAVFHLPVCAGKRGGGDGKYRSRLDWALAEGESCGEKERPALGARGGQATQACDAL